MSAETGWFTTQDISNMIAVSESTPGPIGINMSTYIGYHTASNFYGLWGGFLGGIISTFALVLPSVIIIELISKIMHRFKESTLVKHIFFGLRPASTALIAAAGVAVAKTAFFTGDNANPFEWKSFFLCIGIFTCIKTFKGHPVIYIAGAAIIGIIFRF